MNVLLERGIIYNPSNTLKILCICYTYIYSRMEYIHINIRTRIGSNDMQNLELLPFLPLSTTFLSFPVLPCGGWVNERTEWTYTHADILCYYYIRQMSCIHTKNDIYIIQPNHTNIIYSLLFFLKMLHQIFNSEMNCHKAV